jgi:heme A synthase
MAQYMARAKKQREGDFLYPGWPEMGGVWILRLSSGNFFKTGFDRAQNAHVTEEGREWWRCLGQLALSIQGIASTCSLCWMV